ncbi:hypothetical protein COCNU_05G009610 [Cocos nucifera]|uniref:Uncharacterized protein n=1 Tax=Cocos nucifera TaxID=13894 RepID=A0A8K0N1P7_COCNU|nr:hypothetical protein COCNU_05G009610 [Cocos nucifera]
MTLLDTISWAAGEAESGGNLPPLSKFPIVLNADDIFPQLKPDSVAPDGASLVKRVSGWKISETDAEIAELAAGFAKTLRRKLKNTRSFDQGKFLKLLNSFLRNNAEKIRLSLGSDPSDASGPDFTCGAIEKLGFLIGREVAALIAEGCVVLELWEVLESLILQGLVGHLNSTNLVEKLVEKSRSELLCLFVKHVPDLRSLELLSVLKYFLSPTEESYGSMIRVRKQWEKQGLLAIEKAAQKGIPKKVSNLAKEASILLMVAYDGFSSSELCLHYVFGSSNLDGLMLSSAISKLDGWEVLGLIRYFVKWLEKYQRFPEAAPCPSAGSVLRLKACESVPSLESVLRGLGLVLDEHFSYLVLNSEFHDEMRAAEKVINSLASEADLCFPVDVIIKYLQLEVKKNEDL